MSPLRVKPYFKRSNVVFAVFYGASLRIRTVAVMMNWSAEWVRDQEVLGSIPSPSPNLFSDELTIPKIIQCQKELRKNTN